MPEETKTESPLGKLRITVDYNPGRWSRVFHLFDKENKEIALIQKDAVSMAKDILRIAKETR